MLVYLAIILFLIGLSASFGTLLAFERDMRHQLRRDRAQVLNRVKVGAALTRLILSSLVSGVGMGLLGVIAFVWGRSGPRGPAAYLWAGLFIIVAVLGWTIILVIAFMARVNTIEHYLEK